MRGVSSAHIIRRLVARNLVKASGKSTLPGRPNLYATTSDFLDYFGLSTIKDLPKLDEESSGGIKEEKDLFTSIYTAYKSVTVNRKNYLIEKNDRCAEFFAFCNLKVTDIDKTISDKLWDENTLQKDN